MYNVFLFYQIDSINKSTIYALYILPTMEKHVLNKLEP